MKAYLLNGIQIKKCIAVLTLPYSIQNEKKVLVLNIGLTLFRFIN